MKSKLNDNDTPKTPSNVLSFVKAKESVPAMKKAKTYEVHLFPTGLYDEDTPAKEEVIKTTGFLKFGPQFIAVVEEAEDVPVPTIVFTIATNSVKYIKSIEDNVVQGILDLG